MNRLKHTLAIIGLAMSSWVSPVHGDLTEGNPFPLPPFASTQEVIELDGDSILDLAFIPTGTSTIEVLRGTGSGLAAAQSFFLGFQPSAVTSADRTGDGVPELIVARVSPPSVLVYAWPSSGPTLLETIDPGGTPLTLGSADFDLDGLADLVVGIQVTIGADTGRVATYFGPSTTPVLLDVGENPSDLRTEDLNGDGFPDLAVASRGAPGDLGGVFVYRSDGGGGFDVVDVPLESPATQLAVADLNDDGALDLVSVANTGTACTTSSWVLLQVAGQFTTATPLSLSCDVTGFTILDADCDNVLDLVFVESLGFLGGELRYAPGLGGGEFATSELLSPGPYTTASPAQIDVDTDGTRELTLPLTGGGLSIWSSPADNFVRGDVNGDGVVDIADPVAALAILFIAGTPPPPCEDSVDANDDGAEDVSDPVAMLAVLFVAGTPPLLPPSTCGGDPTFDLLTCDSNTCP